MLEMRLNHGNQTECEQLASNMVDMLCGKMHTFEDSCEEVQRQQILVTYNLQALSCLCLGSWYDCAHTRLTSNFALRGLLEHICDSQTSAHCKPINLLTVYHEKN